MNSKAREAQCACVSREADVDGLLSGGASANTSSNIAQSDDAHQAPAPLVKTGIDLNRGRTASRAPAAHGTDASHYKAIAPLHRTFSTDAVAV